MRADLVAETHDALVEVRKRGGPAVVFAALGIRNVAARSVGFLGVARIETSGDYWAPDEAGRLAVILPVADVPFDVTGWEPIDLLAFFAADPATWFVRTGAAQCVGAWQSADARCAVPIWRLPSDPPIQPLHLYQTPLSWLRADCDGDCVLHGRWMPFVLAGIDTVSPDTPALAQQLHTVLYRRPSNAPRIMMRRKEGMSA